MAQDNDKTPAPAPDEQPIDQRNQGNTVRASWNFSIDDVRTNIARYRPEAKEALIKAFLWCIDPRHPMSKPEFARRVGYSDNVIYKLFTGKYVHPDSGKQLDAPDSLIKSINEFLRLEHERYIGGRTDFVMTPTAKRIVVSCDLARESQTPVMLWGPSQLGKTTALVYYTGSNNHGRTQYIRMLAASGLGGMVKRIADACGISDKSNTAALIERIKRGITPNTLLILDEVHLLAYTYRRESFFACLEVIREIYDETQCGMVLCGTHLLMERVRGAEHAELEQVLKRGVHRVPLPTMPTKGDLAMILEHSGLEFPPREFQVTVKKLTDRPYDILRQIAKRDGLKAICERLRYARKLASKSGGSLTWERFVEAHTIIEKQAEQEGDWD